MELCIVGLNHRTTPLEFREQFAVPADRVPCLLAELRTQLGVAEAVILSTCNRLEIYTVCPEAPVCPEQVFAAIQRAKGVSVPVDFQQVEPCLYVHKGSDCVRHVFRVASSLDSLVVGETEIVGQVKKAYQLAQANGATGKLLNRLFQKALSVSKEVRTRSGVGRCSTSVGSVALDLAMKIFGEDLSQRTIVIIGAGKMGETTLKHLTKHGAKEVLVINRSLERAQELVTRFQGEAMPWSELGRALARADIVVSSTSAPHYVLTKSDVAAAVGHRPDRPLLLVDLAVPRDIDPAAAQIRSVYLSNIDELAELARANMERRQKEATTCESLVANHAREVSAGLLIGRPLGEVAPVARQPFLPQFEPVGAGFA